MHPTRILSLLSLLGVLPALLALESIARPATAEAATRTQQTVLVASANVREGARIVRPADTRSSSDRRTFARRLLTRGNRVPDVVLLQEAMGTAGKVARTLNAHPRAKRLRATYAVVVRAGSRHGNRTCDGRRRAHQVIRDGAILVNTRTIARVHQRGFVRTWGKWFPHRGVPTYACAEQGWVQVSVRHGAPGRRQALIANLHMAPTNVRLKTRALTRTVSAVQRHATARTMLVLGGDYNLTRCQGRPKAPERAGCTVRAGHRFLARHGFRDAVRSTHLTGRAGVVGARRRIDFIHTQQPVVNAWWDRCYLAFSVSDPSCRSRTAQFPRQRTFTACQSRLDRNIHAGGSCGQRRFRRYYSDHPIVRATIRWR